jgi:Branched-chain amino acid transport protein (AzlD)
MSLPDLWPYAVVVLCGFLPTEVWRVLGVVLGKGLDEEAEALVFIRMIATGLVAAVVAKLLLSPIGALATIPLAVRVGALLLGVAATLAAKRSVLVGLLVGEGVFVAAALILNRGGV